GLHARRLDRDRRAALSPLAQPGGADGGHPASQRLTYDGANCRRMTMDRSDKQMMDASSILRTQYSVLSIQYLVLALLVSGLVPFPARRMLIASDQPTNADKPIDAKLNAEAETPNSAPGSGPSVKGRPA